MTSVGTDVMEIWTGKLVLDLPNTSASVKGEDPEEYTKGLGLRTSSFPGVYEGTVTMGANAAKKLMDRKGLMPADIGRIGVATESTFDSSKPVPTYIAGCLEQVYDGNFRHANKGECKFVRIADTQSLGDTYNWIKAGRNRGRAVLVIAADTALYERGDPGEAMQDVGAVAMFIDKDPDLVEFLTERDYGSMDGTNFLRPNQQFPSVDGKRSMQVYLARMHEALEDCESVAGRTYPDLFEYIPFHTPFPGMVRKAAFLGFHHMTRDTDIEDDLENEIGRQLREEDFEMWDDYEGAICSYMDELKTTEQYHDWYGYVIEPTLDISNRVGSWYTGSVHITRLSVLKAVADEGGDMTGKQLLVGSHGPGTQAEIHAERVQETWLDEIEAADVDDQLAARTEVSFDNYELTHDVHNHEKETEAGEFT